MYSNSGYILAGTGFEVYRIDTDNAAFSGGTANAYATVFSASGIGSGVHGSISLLNRGPNSLDYFLGGNDSYGTLTSGTSVTLILNAINTVNLDSVVLSSGKSPLISIEIQAKSTAPNNSGLLDLRASIIT